MLIGHYAAGFVAGAKTRRLPLWVFFIAVQAIDFLWALLIIIGIEEASVDTTLHSVPLDLSFMPFSHGLVAAALWSLLAYVGYRRMQSASDEAQTAFVLAAAVFSHWVLDLIVHRPDLPLVADWQKVGLSLWNREVLGFLVEALLLVIALFFYLRSTSGGAKARFWSYVGLGAALLAVQVMTIFGPFPEGMNIRLVAASILALYIALTAAVYWIESKWSIGLVQSEFADSTDPASSAARADESPVRYEAIVVGTGFGGAISACRLADRWPGEVLVLERGKRYGLGSFARSPRSGMRNLWNVSEEPRRRSTFVDKHDRGLYDLRSFDGLDAIVASGVGGGSLIYANVFLEPPDAVFDDPRWPATCDRSSMAPYYAVAKEVLGARTIPDPNDRDDEAREVLRTGMFGRTAVKLGRKSKLAEINVFFGNDHDNPLPPGVQDRNRYGALQTSCVYCSECIVGCNVHAKNTVDLNYLYVAENVHRAHVATGALAQRVVPLNASGSDDPHADGSHGYRVYFHDLDAGTLASATANRVVVSAGTLGSTELLLRSRDVFRTLPRVSPALGSGFSGNGDFLSYVMANEEAVDPNDGPTITQYTDFNLFDDHDPDRAFILQDAGYPSSLAWFVEGLRPKLLRFKAFSRWIRHVGARFLRGRSGGRVGYAIRDLNSADYSYTTAVLLFMGRDKATGRLDLDRNGRLTSKWPVKENMKLYRAIVKASKDFKKANGAKTYFPVPTWLWPARKNVTVHPLGGCRLADDPVRGVVDADRENFGSVFGYRNLFVADGAIVPAAVGANPIATISALSEMVAEGITGNEPNATLRSAVRGKVEQ